MRKNSSVSSVAVVLAIGCAVAHAESVSKEPPQQRTLHFAGTGTYTLDVRTITGNVRIEGYDGVDVLLTTTRSTTADSAADLEAAKRDVTLNVADGSDTITAIVRYADGDACDEHEHHGDRHGPDYEVRYDFVIKVPRDTRLQVCTINDGHVNVSGTRADFVLHSINGPIEFADMGGSGEATTINGAVKGTFSAAPRRDSLFRTINGSIVLTLPQALAAELKMKTFNGGLYTDFDTQPVTAPQAIVTEHKGDKTIYQSNAFARVRIGSGGPEMTLDTFNGDVRVLRRAN